MKSYLESSVYVDWTYPKVKAKANALSAGRESSIEVVSACFEFVRDEIKHSWDYQLNPVTLKASDVLEHRTGFCYAKSHLLAALLRANGIPAALCYQRLTIADDRPPFCLHGLNAVYLEKYGWVRLDARGNKEGVQAAFNPPGEYLAFDIKNDGERDIEGWFAEPLAEVVDTLKKYPDIHLVAENLPDVD